MTLTIPALALPLVLACGSGRGLDTLPGGDGGGADGGSADGGGDGGGADGGADGGAVEADCDEEDAAAFSDLQTESTLAGPVLRARWVTDLQGTTEIWFTDGVVTELAPEAAEGGTAVLVGPGPLTPVQWRVVVETDQGRVCSPVQEATSGASAPGIPELTQLSAGDPGAAMVIAPVIGADSRFLVIVDRAGRLIWSQTMESNAYRAVLARGGGAMWVGTPAWSDQDNARIRKLELDGSVAEERSILGGHTDLVELPDASLAMLGWDIRERDGRQMLGDTIVELATDGSQRRVWSTWDDYEPDLSFDYSNDFYAADPSVEDWTHANGLHYAESDDSYYVTLSTMSLLVRIDRVTGALVWSVGATSPTVQTPEGLIDNPHSVQRLTDGSYLVFNRGKGSCSSVVRFTVDESAGQASLISRYESPDCLQVLFLGDARQTDDGHTYISWSSAGRLEELDPTGAAIREVDVSLGAVLGFIDPVEDVYAR